MPSSLLQICASSQRSWMPCSGVGLCTVYPYRGMVDPSTKIHVSPDVWFAIVGWTFPIKHMFGPGFCENGVPNVDSIYIWLVVLTILKNISPWEGLSHISWKKSLQPPTRYPIHIPLNPHFDHGTNETKPSIFTTVLCPSRQETYWSCSLQASTARSQIHDLSEKFMGT